MVSNWLEIVDSFLAPNFDKVFKRTIFNELFKYLTNHFSSHQSGFIPGDSCVQKLIRTTHGIYKVFDYSSSLEVRGVFLDISKVFDKVWPDELLYKLKRNGINRDLLKLRTTLNLGFTKGLS